MTESIFCQGKSDVGGGRSQNKQQLKGSHSIKMLEQC